MNTLLDIKKSWLSELQQKHRGCFMQNTLPICTGENWKYTDTSVLQKYNFELPTAVKINSDLLTPYLLPSCYHLVFVDGCYQPQFMAEQILPEGVIITNLAEALEKHSEIIQASIEATKEQMDFESLNLALLTGGSFIYVPANVTLSKSVQILSLMQSDQGILMQHPRHLIVAEANSKFSVFENYIGSKEKIYFTNALTQIKVNRGAQVTYYKYQQESVHAFHIAKTIIDQQEDSYVRGYHFALGGKLAREDLQIELNGAQASCVLQGLYWPQNQQHIDNHIRVDHNVSCTTSHQLYKGVAQDKATAVFNGKIVVQPKIHKINANLTNRNLLLDKAAAVNTKPELEIYADDVKCSHGATVGQIDEAALFYLQSRGIERQQATALLTFAFANEIIESLTDSTVRSYVESLLQKKLATLMSVKS